MADVWPLAGLEPGELLVLGADDVEEALGWVQAHIARLSGDGERGGVSPLLGSK